MTFEEALNDEYCRKTMNLLGRWMPRLDKNELKQLQLIALWETVETFDPKKSKFTTHLYNRLRFKYLKHINSKKNKLGKKQDVWYSREDFNGNSFFEGLSELNRKILEDRYIARLSLNEMANKYGVKRQTLKDWIESAKSELKKTF